MRWVRRLLLGFAVLLLAGLAFVLGRSLLWLDWSRSHTSETAALPVLADVSADGLVQVDANGMRFRARVAGMVNEGPGVILLHGFPATSLMWEPVLEAGAAAGYRLLALDQRGYSPGARPDGVDAYRVPLLVDDVIAVADAAGFERFHLVGHDWGCVVGWGVAIRNGDRVRSWSGLSIPHPGALLAGLRKGPPPYIRVFTAPWVPEIMLSANGLEYSPPTPPHHAEEYHAVFREPGALTGALNWYRAITTSLEDGERLSGPVHVPTLFVWGTDEQWVTPERLQTQRTLMKGPYRELELEAGHWVLEARTEAVVRAVMATLREADAAGSRP